MRILQLCVFTNFWDPVHEVESHDLKFGKDILDLPDNYGKDFDFIISSPPCTQFTIANTLNWLDDPKDYTSLAEKCLTISELSGKKWILENPPGRITTFLPRLKNYRLVTWFQNETNKQYVLYGNTLIMKRPAKRYGGKPVQFGSYPTTRSKREEWLPGLIIDIEYSITKN